MANETIALRPFTVITDKLASFHPINLLWYHWRRNSYMVTPPWSRDGAERIFIDRPIFLLGNQGGGLTLVSRMLRRHRQVISITGDHTYWAGADEMQKVMLPRLPRTLRLGGRLFDDGVTHKRFTPPRSWSYASNDLIDQYRRTAADYDEAVAGQLRAIIRDALYRHGKGRTALRFVDKSQVFTVKMSYVYSLLKDSDPHFVLITRNPYAACYRAAKGRAGDMKRYGRRMSLKERVEICAQHWSNAIGSALTDSKIVPCFKVTTFEEFLRCPEEALRQLCEFLDLAFYEDMVPKPHHRLPLGSRYRNRWYPLREDVNAQYLAEIPQEYVEIVAQHCGPLANQLGYEQP